jgi:Protein of unknown function/AsmA-like C-terminal region
MKRRAGQAGRVVGEAIHQLGRILMIGLLLVLLAVCVLGFRLSLGPLQIPDLASWLATAASGEGITVRMQEADLGWAGYHQGGGVPLYLRLGEIDVRNAEGVELVEIPSARLEVLPAALFGARSPVMVSGTDARFPGSAVPVSLLAAIRIGPGFNLARADVSVTLGAGRLGAGVNSLPIEAGGFTLAVTPGAVQLTDGHLALAHVGNSTPQIGVTGAAQRGKVWQGSISATVNAVQAQNLAAYWPPAAIPQTRKWVTQNIIAGTATDAAFTFAMAAPRDLASLSLTDVSGHFTGTNVALNWIPKAQPITQLNGELVMLDRDKMVITASTARLGGLGLSDGRMVITGLSARDQFGQLSLKVGGTIPDTIAVLNAPPMNLLRQALPQLVKATGRAQGTVTVGLPFKNNLRFEDVELHVSSELSNVAFAGPLTGLDFSDGFARLDATNDRLDVQGHTQFAGEPATLSLTADFKRGGNANTVVLSSVAGPILLHWFGLDTPSVFADPVTGRAPYSVRIVGDSAGTQMASLSADLAPAALAAPAFGWRKEAGVAGHLALAVTLENGVPVALNSISATAPGLDLRGQGDANRLVFSAADIGRTRARGALSAPAGPQGAWTADFNGPELDLRLFRPQSAETPLPGAAPSAGPPWGVNLDFQQLDLAPSPAPDLAGFVFAGTGQGGALLRGEGRAGGIALIVAPAGPVQRHLTLQAPDAGALLRALGAYNGLEGGNLSLDATYGGAAPVTGTLKLTQFRLLQAPAFTKVLQGITVYGAPAAASGPGLELTRAEIPFSVDSQTLHLHDARASSASLGFTATGSVLLANGDANLDATIVPAYWLNALPGKIPVLGKLFTAEKGGGLFAVRAKITGRLSNPQVSVNPLSALTPGVLRDIFGLGGAAK